MGGWDAWECVSLEYFCFMEQQQLVQVPGQIWLGSAAPVAGYISPGRGRHGHKLRVTSILEEGHENVQSHPCLSSQGCLLPRCSLAYILAALSFLTTTLPPVSMAVFPLPETLMEMHTPAMDRHCNREGQGQSALNTVTNSDLPLHRPSKRCSNAPPWLQQRARQPWDITDRVQSRINLPAPTPPWNRIASFTLCARLSLPITSACLCSQHCLLLAAATGRPGISCNISSSSGAQSRNSSRNQTKSPFPLLQSDAQECWPCHGVVIWHIWCLATAAEELVSEGGWWNGFAELVKIFWG